MTQTDLPKSLLSKFNRKLGKEKYNTLNTFYFTKSGCGKYWRFVKPEHLSKLDPSKEVFTFTKDKLGKWSVKKNTSKESLKLFSYLETDYSFGGSPGVSSVGSSGLSGISRGGLRLPPSYHQDSLDKVKSRLLGNKKEDVDVYQDLPSKLKKFLNNKKLR